MVTFKPVNNPKETFLVQELNRALTTSLEEMKASYPYYNPNYIRSLPGKEQVCEVLSVKQQGDTIGFTFKENGAKVVEAQLVYTLNGGKKSEEWYLAPAEVRSGGRVTAEIPKGATHVVLNLIDENNFLVSYPEMVDTITKNKTKENYSENAIAVH